MNRCDQCRYVYDAVAPADVSGRLRSSPPRYRQAILGASPEVACQRPEAEVWSAVEYACHVRDVLLVQRDRAVLALVEDRPSFARMYRDDRVSLCRYAQQDTDAVLAQLAMAADLCALVFDGLDGAAWSRPLVYNWPEPAELDLAWLGRHTLHEVEHHLQDIVAGLRCLSATG
ncbi:MAG TPA: DinB family protein [Pseudonocardiaceae bacterium]